MKYDKTEINSFAQKLYNEKMAEGKHGHYETMFHVIHKCIQKVNGEPVQSAFDRLEECKVKPDGTCDKCKGSCMWFGAKSIFNSK